MSKQKFGRAFIKTDGSLLETMPGAKIDIGGVARKEVVGSHGGGFAEEHKLATLDCEIMMGPETSLAAIGAIDDATVTFECDTGQIYVMRNAWVAETPAATEGEGGKVPVKFQSEPAEEVM